MHVKGHYYETFTLRTVASALVEEGISTFRFDFSGNGDSEGNFSYGNYWKEVEDIRSVTSFWRAENRQVSFLMGHSKGGNAVLLYASKYGEVPVIVNMSGRFALERGIAERLGENFMQEIEELGFLFVGDKSGNVDYKVTKESLQDRLNTDMKTACLSISKSCRVLTVHGSWDMVVPVADAYEFDKVIPSHQLKVVDGADHSFRFHQSELIEAVLQFI
ncbi:hypothetical protein O6H91_21G068900 [Diphasiastrum complanatum]|uniref:Uncharacterized protein n=2 Tax=Diphasiastrum complanatum TaxID=34168 RepID=A0ACC2ALL4_DIPCM|nr:hypothetical protein O6H91_21G068900 [Diphasiastrum complanatum]